MYRTFPLKLILQLAEDDPTAYVELLKSQAKAAEAEQSKQLVRGSCAQFIIEAQLAQPAGLPVAVHIWAARDGRCEHDWRVMWLLGGLEMHVCESCEYVMCDHWKAHHWSCSVHNGWKVLRGLPMHGAKAQGTLCEEKQETDLH